MNQPLNNKQRKLVEDNHNLIFSFLQSRGLSLDSAEDWYGVAAIGLCQAARAYDESVGAKFSTLAYKAMDNEVKRVYRGRSKDVAPSISLDEVVLDDPTLTLGNIVPDLREDFSSVDVSCAIDKAMNKLSGHQRKIVKMLLSRNLSQGQVAEAAHLSRSRVSRIYKDFLESVKTYCAI